jgi:3-isopropylmalate/(R)-2-methylmalate dehydratase small subunit
MSADQITGTGVPVRGDGIACDQILPDETEGASDLLFADAGEGVVEYLTEDQFADANVLLVNRDFGVGDARPAVAEALTEWGIEAIVGESFGSAFADDCRAAGIAAVTASEGDVRAVQEWIVENPGGKLEVDVADELLVYGVRNHDEREGGTYQPGFAAEEFVAVTVAD